MTDNPKEVGLPLLVAEDTDSPTQGSLEDVAPISVSNHKVDTQVSEDSTSANQQECTVDLTVPPVSVHRSEGYLIENKKPSTSSSSDSVKKPGHRRSRSDGFEKAPVKVLVNGQPVQTNGGLQFPERKPSRTVSQGGLRHRICIEEIVPSHSSYLGDHKEENEVVDWKTDLDDFTSKKQDKSVSKKLPRRIKRYYKLQDELITAFENLHLDLDDAMENAEQELKTKRWADILSKISFFCNLLLLIGKSVAAGMSGSLAVISSVIDSAVDLVSGALMWWSNRAVKNRNIYEYPQGRTKLEPVAIVVLSVVMSLASVQMVRESVEKIIYYSKEKGDGPKFEIPTIVICSLTVVIKFIMWLVCRRIKNPSVQALSQDHRNDVLSNTIAIVCGLIGDRLWPFADPIGAIVISLYIIVSWFLTGWEQIKMLTGVTARPDFLKKITWIALNHNSAIMFIDTVRAFHFGSNFLVEVDIVLPEEMSLRESHDIGESLQLKIERLPEVERAFVHLDYETEHSPFSEHKQDVVSGQGPAFSLSGHHHDKQTGNEQTSLL